MTGIANSLRISESTLGHAHSIFRLASNNNFIQGRRIDTVAAVCLYAACRMTSPCRVMLMDFADNRNVSPLIIITTRILIGQDQRLQTRSCLQSTIQICTHQ